MSPRKPLYEFTVEYEAKLYFKDFDNKLYEKAKKYGGKEGSSGMGSNIRDITFEFKDKAAVQKFRGVVRKFKGVKKTYMLWSEPV